MANCPLCDHPYEGHKGIFVDIETRVLIIDGELIRLTYRRCQILEGMLKCAPRPANLGYLMDYVYGTESDNEPDDKVISIYICKIRKKIAHTRFGIETIWGFGWKITEFEDVEGKRARQRANPKTFGKINVPDFYDSLPVRSGESGGAHVRG